MEFHQARTPLLDALDAILDLLVQLPQPVDVLLAGLPVAPAVGLQKRGDHRPEGVGVGVEELLPELVVGHEGSVSILVDPVVDGARGSGPAHGVAEALGDLADALVAAGNHALVPLGVEELGARVEADGLGEGAHLGVGGGGVGDEGGGHLAVLAEGADELGGVGVEVVADVGERDLRRVEVLECHIDGLQRAPEDGILLVHDTGPVRVEGEALAAEVHVLELLLVLPAAVLDGEVDVRRVGARGVREDPGGRLAKGDVQLLGLLERVLANKVHLERLVGLGRHLDRAVHKSHLVDEQITEDAGAVDDDVDTGPAELLKRDQAKLVHATELVRLGNNAEHPHDLGEGLAVRLNVVGAPQYEADRLRVLAAGIEHLALKETVDDDLGVVNGGRGRDGLRVERVDVLAGREDVRVADGVAAGAREDVVAVESGEEPADLVVLDDLTEAELEVGEEGLEVILAALEAGRGEGTAPGGLEAEAVGEEAAKVEALDLVDAALRVSGGVDAGADGEAGSLCDLLEKIDVLEDTAVGTRVDVVDVAALGLGDDAGQRLEALTLLRTVERADVDEGGNGLDGGGGDSDGVEAARQEPGFDLDQLLVHVADNQIALVKRQLLGGAVRELDVVLKVADAGLLDDGVDDGGAAALRLTETLVRGDELRELLEALVEAGVLGGRGEVGDGGGVGAALGDGGLRRVIGGVVVEVGDGLDELVRVASIGHADLLAGHELEGAVGAKVENCVGLVDLLEVRVVRGEAVVGAGALGEQEAHRVSLVAKGGLDADEDVTKVLAVDQKVLAVGVEMAGRGAPVLVQGVLVVADLFILRNRHLVGDVELRRGELGLLVVDDLLEELVRGLGDDTDVVALGFEMAEDRKDRVEDVEVCCGTDVALVRGEGEDCDGELLLRGLLLAESAPLESALGDDVDAVLEGDGPAGGAVPAGKDDGLECAVDLRERDLEGDLDGVEAEIRVAPLLGGLEDEGEGTEVGAVELGEGGDGLGVVLLRGAADEGEACEGDDDVDVDGAVAVGVEGCGVVEKLVDGDGEVEAAGKDGDDFSAAGLELGDEGDVVAVVAGDHVGSLEDEADGDGGGLVVAGDFRGVDVVVPGLILGDVFEPLVGDGVPDADVGEDDGLGDLGGVLVDDDAIDVLLRDHGEEVLDVLRGAAEPVLK
mmetsp:Transcript_25720/g.64239  ORF Transcript_25720/g.64239 Transcript_25720/m.64239 type:complete len:1163 (-) Transcript_25720:603-4091(-)